MRLNILRVLDPSLFQRQLFVACGWSDREWYVGGEGEGAGIDIGICIIQKFVAGLRSQAGICEGKHKDDYDTEIAVLGKKKEKNISCWDTVCICSIPMHVYDWFLSMEAVKDLQLVVVDSSE